MVLIIQDNYVAPLAAVDGGSLLPGSAGSSDGGGGAAARQLDMKNEM